MATTTKGLGLIAGPLVAGALIDALEPHLEATGGYQVLWPFCAFLVAAAIPAVASLQRVELQAAAQPEPGEEAGAPTQASA